MSLLQNNANKQPKLHAKSVYDFFDLAAAENIYLYIFIYIHI